ncbi:hypothetical protein CFK38_03670 [Brachybacterium vulturis]|uniref:Uncharacterized protein n=1 Tax=Brachybacterium vulturis TaxID=2017484 RepID=A0A291GKJ2_9MICO|nr:hypothetical protein CFK38_03670 [Brachybacterium vulturis]
MLRSWADRADRSRPRLESLLLTLTDAVRSVQWVGPDVDGFRSSFSAQVEQPGRALVDRLEDLGLRARSDAEEQDAASASEGTRGGTPMAPGRSGGRGERRARW